MARARHGATTACPCPPSVAPAAWPWPPIRQLPRWRACTTAHVRRPGPWFPGASPRPRLAPSSWMRNQVEEPGPPGDQGPAGLRVPTGGGPQDRFTFTWGKAQCSVGWGGVGEGGASGVHPPGGACMQPLRVPGRRQRRACSRLSALGRGRASNHGQLEDDAHDARYYMLGRQRPCTPPLPLPRRQRPTLHTALR